MINVNENNQGEEKSINKKNIKKISFKMSIVIFNLFPLKEKQCVIRLESKTKLYADYKKHII